MNLWPSFNWPVPPALNTSSPESLALRVTLFSGTAFPTSNLAIFVPFNITHPTLITELFAVIGGSTSGNIDMAIYDVAGTKLTSDVHGSQSGAGAIQRFNITDYLLGVGLYYVGIAMDNGTGTLNAIGATLGLNMSRAMGVMEMATAYPLPANATFAALSHDYVPLVGLASGKGVL